jgi:hypothetical protein
MRNSNPWCLDRVVIERKGERGLNVILGLIRSICNSILFIYLYLMLSLSFPYNLSNFYLSFCLSGVREEISKVPQCIYGVLFLFRKLCCCLLTLLLSLALLSLNPWFLDQRLIQNLLESNLALSITGTYKYNYRDTYECLHMINKYFIL